MAPNDLSSNWKKLQAQLQATKAAAPPKSQLSKKEAEPSLKRKRSSTTTEQCERTLQLCDRLGEVHNTQSALGSKAKQNGGAFFRRRFSQAA
jgi:hypothetical protein